jgi:hypothetical protein
MSMPRTPLTNAVGMYLKQIFEMRGRYEMGHAVFTLKHQSISHTLKSTRDAYAFQRQKGL